MVKGHNVPKVYPMKHSTTCIDRHDMLPTTIPIADVGLNSALDWPFYLILESVQLVALQPL